MIIFRMVIGEAILHIISPSIRTFGVGRPGAAAGLVMMVICPSGATGKIVLSGKAFSIRAQKSATGRECLAGVTDQR